MVQKLLFLPELASAHGGALDRLTLYVHLLMVVLFVGWSIYFVIALVQLPRLRSTRRRIPTACRVTRRRYVEVGGDRRRSDPAARLLGPALGRARRPVSRREAMRPWCGWSASSSPGTSTIPAPTACSARPISSSSTRSRTRSASTARIRPRPTTSRPSTSSTCRSTSRRSSTSRAWTSFTASRLQEMRVKQDAIPGIVDARLVRADRHERRHEEAQGRRQVELRDLLRAALRPRPLPHARLRDASTRPSSSKPGWIPK